MHSFINNISRNIAAEPTKETEKIVISEEIGKEAEKILAKINSEMEKIEQIKEKTEQKIKNGKMYF